MRTARLISLIFASIALDSDSRHTSKRPANHGRSGFAQRHDDHRWEISSATAAAVRR